jgi:small conductance mechanosensitive channel
MDIAATWHVYFDTNRLIRETFGDAGFPATESHVRLHQLAA